MHILDIPNFSTIIAPSQMHRHLRKSLLEGHNGRLGINIQSPKQYFALSNMNISDVEIFFKYQLILNDFYTNDCKNGIYSSLTSDLNFLKECKNFLDLCKLYQIPLTDFKDKSQELYDILILLYPVSTNMDFIVENMEKQINEKLYIVDTHYSFIEDYLLETLQLYPHEKIHFDTFEIIGFNYALNKRQEIESIAQKIIDEQLLAEDITISLCDFSYEEVLQRIFTSYKIPHTFLQKRKSSKIARCTVDLLRFYLEPSAKNARVIIEASWFFIPHKYAYLEILDTFQLAYDDKLPNIDINDFKASILDPYSLKHLIQNIAYAKIAQESFLQQIAPLRTSYKKEELFFTISNLIKEIASRLFITSELLPVYTLLQECEEYLQSNEDYELLFMMLSELSIKEPQREQGILISSVQKPLLPRTYHFILGNMQSSYPSFPAMKGIFNERFVEHTTFPSITKRYEQHLNSLNSSLLHSPNTYISYSVGDYTGGNNESSLEMESLCKSFDIPKATEMLLHQTYQSQTPSMQLSLELAQQLYLKNQTLKASVSAFEKYTSCAFSYFLRYGLHLREQQSLSSLQSNVVGSIYHKLLEKSVIDYGNAYADLSSKELLKRIHEEIHYLNLLFPKKEKEYNILTKRIFQSMTKSLFFLNDLQSESLYKDILCEQEFTYTISLDSYTIELHGFIDRMDQKNHKIILIDYKSTNKKLDDKSLLAGLQLQLATYAWIIEELFHKKVIGSFYVSMKEETLGSIASSTNNRGKSLIKEWNEFDAMASEEEEIKSRRLNGWIYGKEILDFDPQATHVDKLSATTTGISATIYDLEKLKDLLKEIYTKISSLILEGNISCEPSENACTYCPYHSICRFQGQIRPTHSLVDIGDLSNYKEKYKLTKDEKEECE